MTVSNSEIYENFDFDNSLHICDEHGMCKVRVHVVKACMQMDA